MGSRQVIASNHRSIEHDGPLGDDHDAIADDKVLAFAVLDMVLVNDAAVDADAAVLVEDGVVDDAAIANAEVGQAAALVVLALFLAVVTISADQHGIAQGDIAADLSADADNAARDGGAGRNDA